MKDSEITTIIQKIARSRVRNATWREDAEQDAWEGVCKATRSHEMSPALVGRIVVNACHGVLRNQMRTLRAREIEVGRCLNLPDVGLMDEIEAWAKAQGDPLEKIILHVITFELWKNQKDLAQQMNVCRQTVARALQALRHYLEEQI